MVENIKLKLRLVAHSLRSEYYIGWETDVFEKMRAYNSQTEQIRVGNRMCQISLAQRQSSFALCVRSKKICDSGKIRCLNIH